MRNRHTNEDPLVFLLKRRGITLLDRSPLEKTVLMPSMTESETDAFYRVMKQYSFRLLMRDIIRFRTGFVPPDLTRYNAPAAVERYLDLLQTIGMVKSAGHRYLPAKADVASFGPTLEWYVAEILSREFGCRSWWGVAVKDTPAGGDFDVIATAEGRLIYIEIKSSPPRQIEENAVSSFFKRIEDLGPDMAIFLEDTHLRMKDKIVPLFEAASFSLDDSRDHPVQRLHREIFSMGWRIYLINSRPDMKVNIGFCLKNYLLSSGRYG